MDDNYRICMDFVSNIEKLRNRHILQIVLFGSVVRGESTSDSDIDIAIIHDSKDVDQLKKKINRFLHEKIQASYFHLSQLPDEKEIISAVAGEGLLLYGQPISVRLRSKELKPQILLIYDTSRIPRKDRMKLNRALHGSTSKSRYKKKEYLTKTTGLVKQQGIQKLANAVLLAEPKKAALITKTLKLFNVRWKEILVWV
jgi:hypothetical protein